MEQTPYNTEPQQQNYSGYNAGTPVMTVGNWIVTMLIMMIPIANIVMLIIWAASSTENPNRKNWAIAQLIFMAIGILIWIALAGAIFSTMGNLAQAFS